MLTVKKYGHDGKEEIYSTNAINYMDKFGERLVILADGTELPVVACNIFVENSTGKTIQVYRA